MSLICDGIFDIKFFVSRERERYREKSNIFAQSCHVMPNVYICADAACTWLRGIWSTFRYSISSFCITFFAFLLMLMKHENNETYTRTRSILEFLAHFSFTFFFHFRFVIIYHSNIFTVMCGVCIHLRLFPVLFFCALDQPSFHHAVLVWRKKYFCRHVLNNVSYTSFEPHIRNWLLEWVCVCLDAYVCSACAMGLDPVGIRERVVCRNFMFIWNL